MRTPLFCLIAASALTAQIQFPDFSNPSAFQFNGAANASNNRLILNPAVNNQVGSAFHRVPLDVVNGFDTVFEFQMNRFGLGRAEGMTFTLQADPRGPLALGELGGELGYGAAAAPGPGVALTNALVIELDTAQNGNDLSSNEISIHTNGTGEVTADEGFSIARVSALSDLSGSRLHSLRVRYMPGTFEVFLDDLLNPILTANYDFQTGGTFALSGAPVGGLSLLGGTSLYAGFTASTGIFNESHEVLSWRTAPYGWQSNQPESSLTFDGAMGDGVSRPGTTRIRAGDPVILDLASTLTGSAFDIGYQATPLVENAIVTAGAQILNLDLFGSSVAWLNAPGLPLPNFLVPFPGSLSLPLSTPSTAIIFLGAQMIVLDPAHPDGLVMSQGAELSTVLCTPNEDFESLPLGTGLPFGWTNAAGGAAAWNVHRGGTSSGSTGPTGAVSGTNYLYAETSGVAGRTFVFETCARDVSGLTTLRVEFLLSRIGSAIGTLVVSLDDGSGNFGNVIATYTGADPNQAQGMTEWSAESIPFIPTGNRVALRFSYTPLRMPPVGGPFHGDLALDAIAIN